MEKLSFFKTFFDALTQNALATMVVIFSVWVWILYSDMKSMMDTNMSVSREMITSYQQINDTLQQMTYRLENLEKKIHEQEKR